MKVRLILIAPVPGPRLGGTGDQGIGRPDERLGEEVVAFVALKPGAAEPDDIIAYCRERLTAYNYPREVRIAADLPKGPTGKILKRELRPE
jgi:long-chain acyl-CoA synthetase